MKYTLRQLLLATMLFAVFCSLTMYLTISCRERLAIRSELQTLGIDGVGFGSRNAVKSIWAHRPVQERFAQKYKCLDVADFRENTSSLVSLEVLAKMDEVTMLILSLSDVSDAEIATLKNIRGLKHLWLTNTRVTDACIDSLAEMQELESVKLSGTTITSQAVDRLQSLMPHLKIQ